MSVGKPLPHESAVGHVTGAARYVEDLAGRYPGLLWAWPVQAPHARARMLGLDVRPALAHPGVVHVLSIDDLRGQGENEVGHGDEPLFPTDEVAYHGQAVAWVLAESREAARQGAQLVRAEYEPLAPILSIEEAITQARFHGGPITFGRGEPALAIDQAPFRLAGEVRMGGQEHFYLETQASLATIDEAGLMQVHSSTQHPAETATVVARVLGWPVNQVIVQTLRMGGAFGGKESQAAPYAALAALGARVTGRPVLVRLGRGEDMTLTGKRHPFLARFDVGFDGEGHLHGLSVELWSDGGWSTDLSPAILSRALLHLDNAYQIPHLRATGQVCRTNKASNTAFRGFGGPQGMLVIEEIMSRVAAYLDLPPHLVRERNFYREGDRTHYGQPVRDAERATRIWTDLKASSRFEERLAEVAAFNSASSHRKRGLAITPVKFGISFTLTHLNQAGALVLIYQDGSVQVNHGGTEMGQGLHTKIAQIAADSLGVPLQSIRVMPTRTDKVPNSSATAASSGTDLNGAAVRAACLALKERLDGVAAGRPLPFVEVVKQAYEQRVQLFATGFYRTPDLFYSKEKGEGSPFRYFAWGAAVCEVELDGWTGESKVRSVEILHDCGDSINPLIDQGQVEGGFVQGLGWLTQEELVWDEKGRLMTKGASTYKLPGANWLPERFEVRFLERRRTISEDSAILARRESSVAAEPGAVFSSKAVGEPPLMLALSVREALRAAVVAFGGPIEIDSPLTPERLFWACKGREGAVD